MAMGLQQRRRPSGMIPGAYDPSRYQMSAFGKSPPLSSFATPAGTRSSQPAYASALPSLLGGSPPSAPLEAPQIRGLPSLQPAQTQQPLSTMSAPPSPAAATPAAPQPAAATSATPPPGSAPAPGTTTPTRPPGLPEKPAEYVISGPTGPSTWPYYYAPDPLTGTLTPYKWNEGPQAGWYWQRVGSEDGWVYLDANHQASQPPGSGAASAPLEPQWGGGLGWPYGATSNAPGKAGVPALASTLTDPYNIPEAYRTEMLGGAENAYQTARGRIGSQVLGSGAAEGGVARGTMGNVEQARAAAFSDAYRKFEILRQQIGDTRLKQLLLPWLQLQNQAVGIEKGVTTPAPESGSSTMDYIMAGIALYVAAGCWVADELYGFLSPRSALARVYMRLLAPPELRDAYLLHGKELATRVHRSPTLRRAVRPIFDSFVDSAVALLARRMR